MELTYDEIVDILDSKYIGRSTKGYLLVTSIYAISDLSLIRKSLLPNDVKVNNKIEYIRLKSNLTVDRTTKFTRKIFFFYYNGLYSIQLVIIRRY